ncbi:DUF5010 domain-containing protein [Burkholderia territorii]|uniref:DUF5010 domain-containing protein n=1 Tax=Burkholderia territorii TaxID=1503055 RepID=UPI0012D9ABF5|nr:DUF5010 domain-containing protein [Burkholderia territorii]
MYFTIWSLPGGKRRWFCAARIRATPIKPSIKSIARQLSETALTTRRAFIGTLALSPSILISPSTDARAGGPDGIYINAVAIATIGRALSAGEKEQWQHSLDTEGKEALLRTVLVSPDCRRFLVANLYRCLLGREPDQGGWQSLSEAARTRGLDDAIVAIVSSDEYYQVRAGSSNRMYVTALARDVLDRSGVDDMEAIVGKLDGGASRAEMVRQLLGSRAAVSAKVSRAVGTYLSRAAVPADITQFGGDGSTGSVMAAVLSSDAFYQRAVRTSFVVGDDNARILDSLVVAAGVDSLDPTVRARLQRRTAQYINGEINLNVVAYELLIAARPLAPKVSSKRSRLAERVASVSRRDASKAHALPAPKGGRAMRAAQLADSRASRAKAAAYLASTECLGWDPSVLRRAPPSWQDAPGDLNVPIDMRNPPPSFRSDERVLCTTYFYWYDVINGADYLKNPDGAQASGDEYAFAVTPSDLKGLSYTLPAWHDEQLRDVVSAGIDVILPVYFGSPFASSDDLTQAEIGANRPSRFSDPGLVQIVAALNRRRQSGQTAPRIGMFYDTTTLTSNNAKSWHVDSAVYAGKAWFYETIRNFFSIVPTEHWACIDGRPVIYVYHPSFAKRVGEDLYPFVRQRFQFEFGVDPYIVSAAEEEAPRVTDPRGLKSIASRFLSASYLDQLADLLGGNEFFGRAGQSTTGFVNRLYEKVHRRSPTQDERRALETVATARGRAAAARMLLGTAPARVALAADLHQRLMPIGQSFDTLQAQLASDGAVRRFVQSGDYYALLADMLASDAFYRFSGSSTDALVEGVLQRVLWRCTNPQCRTCSTTSTDGAMRDELRVRLKMRDRRSALLAFVKQYPTAEALASYALFYYLGRFYPGPFDSTFYWSAAICPTFRGVVSIGPGYSQKNLSSRHPIEVPRENGALYRRNWERILAMDPRPTMVHIETWNEFFEGTAICDSKEYGRQYIELTAEYAKRYKAT